MHFLKSVGVVAIVFFIIQLMGCGKDDLIELLDSDERYTQDVIIINEYIAAKGWDKVDSTASGVRYVVLDTGDGASIEYRNIVTLDFTGRTTDDVIFRTTLQEVVDADTTDATTFATDPLIFSHSQGGWLLDENYDIEDGFSEGISVLLDTLNVNGTGILLIPSYLGFGSLAFSAIPANSVLVYEVLPIKVRK